MDDKTRLVAMVLVIPLIMGMIGYHRQTPSSTGDDPLYQRIDEYVQEQIDGSRIPGAAIAIVQNGEIVHARGFGTDDGAAIDPQSPFPIGSLTKSFTALAAMQLVEAGALELDASIQRYIPWFEVAGSADASQMTVRHLLSQTSGFSRVSGLRPIVEEWDGSAEDYVRKLRSVSLNRPIGASYEYSNVNFVILGLLVETVSGQSYGDYVEQHIFAPLSMVNSYTSHADGREHGMVSVHRYWFGQPFESETTDLPGQVAEGFLVASAEDMARYLLAYLGEGHYDGEQILSPDGIATLLAPTTEEFNRTLLSHDFTARYAMGWFAGPFGEEQALWHLGQLPSFTAWMVLLPETNQGVIVLINASSQMEVAGATGVFSHIPIGVTNLLNGYEAPEGIGLTRFYTIFDASLLVILALQVWALIRLLRRPIALTLRPRTFAQARSLARNVLPLSWEMGLGLLILFGYPALLGLGWRGVFWSTPDLALGLLAIAGLWLVTAAIRGLRIAQPYLSRQQARSGGPQSRSVRDVTAQDVGL